MISEVIFFLLIIILLYWKFFKNTKNNEGNFNEIPCLKGLPLVGNIGDFFCSETELWKRMRQRNSENYPIYRQKIFNTEMVYLLHPDDVEMVLDGTVLTTKGLLYETLTKFVGKGLVTSEGNVWRGRRKLLTKCFHFSILQKYVKIFNENMRTFYEKNIQHGVPTEVFYETKLLTLRIINDIMIGQKMNDTLLVKFSKAVDVMTKMITYRGAFPFADIFIRHSSLAKTEDESIDIFDQFSMDILRKHHEESNQIKKRDFASMIEIMLNAPDHFKDTESIQNEVKTISFAGHDTTATAFAFALTSLASYPQFQKKIYEEIIDVIGPNKSPTFTDLKSMEYLDRYVKECLRIYPPVMWIARSISKEFKTKTGYTIPAGKLVVIYIYDFHHNPKLFPEPKKFDPDRFLLENISNKHPFAYIPFGAGARNCIAQKFAFLELKTCLCDILQKFTLETDRHINDFTFTPDVILKVNEKMNVKFIPRI